MAQNENSSFKITFDGSSLKQMKIPPSFCSGIQRPLRKIVYLRDGQKNRLWPVKTLQIGKYWFFHNGWMYFVHDNSIEPTDSLEFKYDGHKIFDFKVFDSSGREKEAIRGVRVKTEVLDDNENEQNEAPGEGQEQVADKVGASRKIRRPKVDPYGHDIFKSGLVRHPKNAYFVTKIDQRQPNYLCIPMRVFKYIKLELPDRPFLIDPEGRKWCTKLTKWANGRVLYNGGWRLLCKENHVSEEDSCICEFKRRRNGTRIDIQVHIVRANGNSSNELNGQEQ